MPKVFWVVTIGPYVGGCQGVARDFLGGCLIIYWPKSKHILVKSMARLPVLSFTWQKSLISKN